MNRTATATTLWCFLLPVWVSAASLLATQPAAATPSARSARPESSSGNVQDLTDAASVATSALRASRSLGRPHVAPPVSLRETLSKQSGTSEITHPIVNTYSLLRNSSDRVGQASEQVQAVAGNLEELQQDLSREYTHWEQRKQAAAADRQRMEAELVQLQEELEHQSKLREEAVRLRADRELHLRELHAAYAEATTSHASWEAQRKALQSEIQAADARLEAATKERAARITVVRARAAEVQNKVQHEGARVADLQAQVRRQEDKLLQLKVAVGHEHAQLLSDIEAARDRGRHLRKELITQAQVRAQRRHLAEQAEKVVRLREENQASWATCTSKLSRLGDEIVDAQRVLAEANKQVAQCQALDAENQRLLQRANRCRAAQRQQPVLYPVSAPLI